MNVSRYSIKSKRGLTHKFKDRTGQRFGRLVAVRLSGRSKAGARWLCKCDCSKMTIVEIGNLVTGHTKSCGCYSLEISAAKFFKHGLSQTKQHRVWSSMIERCSNPKNKCYKMYGGRGIKVCDRWKSFSNWWKDMCKGYEPKLTLNRMNNDGNYEPSNCCWASLVDQANNRRTNHFLILKGKRLTIAQWSRKIGIHQATLWQRINRGWSISRALNHG